VGTYDRNKKAGIPTTTGIPASKPADYRRNFGLKKQPGFLVHVTYEDAQGFVVAEVWETHEQHDSWFDANVKPNIPFEITQEVVDLHSVHTP
jgi:hypothetical protein